MIDIKELRLGDLLYLVHADKKEIIYVDALEFLDEQIMYATYLQKRGGFSSTSYYEPILITEELLLKLGFIKEEDSISHDFDFKKWIDGYPITIGSYSNTIDRDYSIHIDNRDYDTILGADIQYLHQLQNAIYFATKNELDVKNIIK